MVPRRTPWVTGPLHWRGRYEPATIGGEPFAWELNGGGGAIDRFALVNT